MYSKGRLAVAEGGICEGIDLFDVRICHGIAACGDTVAMHHECRARAAIGLVIGIRIAEVKGEMILTVRIHLLRRHRVKAFRPLKGSLLLLRSKLAGSRTDRIHAKETELLARLHPHFELFRGFKDTQEDGGAIVQSSGAHRPY